MAYTGHQILYVIWLFGAGMFAAKGFANLRGKGLDKKATARVRTEELPAWRRVQAICSFLLAALLLTMGVGGLINGGRGAAQNPVWQHSMAGVIGIAVLDLGFLTYAHWRYARKQDDET